MELQEWTITKSAYKNKWLIDHRTKDHYNYCYMPYHVKPIEKRELYRCNSCKNKAPEHIILQAQILNGD